MDNARNNGGFPAPREGEPVRLLSAHHETCSATTRIRLPRAVPSRAVRRVVCERCDRPFEPASVVEQAISAAPAKRRISRDTWRWLGLPIAALAVLAVLYAVQRDEPAATPAAPAGAIGSGAGEGQRAGRELADAQLVSESTFQVALPAGWERSTATGGATFAAKAPGGDADVTLWVERNAKLDFATFEARSLAQLETLAGSAHVVERRTGPTPGETSVLIAPTTAPTGAPHYEVLLRTSGDNWFYLATTVQPEAAPTVSDETQLIRRSFLPLGGRG